MKKQKKKHSKTTLIITYALLLCALAITLFFPSFFENIFKLKPDLSIIKNNALEVHFVDVGQGDAILIRLPDHKTMMIDSGETSAKSKLLNYIDHVFFKKTKNKSFDYVILTHSDSDHAGNMLSVLNTYEVKNFYRPQILCEGEESTGDKIFVSKTKTYANIIHKLNELSNKGKINVTINEAGNEIIGENELYKLTFCTPNKIYYNNPNDYSPIIVLEAYGKKYLFTGDASISVEQEAIANSSAELLDCDVLKLGHHGSKTSTDYVSGNESSFLNVVSPTYAIISVGKNTYGHPSVETLEKIIDYSKKHDVDLVNNTYQTLEMGNIISFVNANNVIDFLTIRSVNDYMFIDWWVIAGGVMVVVTIAIVIPFLPKQRKKAKL